eukprot:2408363-Amphidinium_carterae.1
MVPKFETFAYLIVCLAWLWCDSALNGAASRSSHEAMRWRMHAHAVHRVVTSFKGQQIRTQQEND